MKPAMIATRNGKPAYMDAPPRLRQSQIERPRPVPMQQPRRSLFDWLRGR